MWRLQQTLCKWSAFLDYQIAVIQLAQVLGITNFATMHSEMLILTANANRHGKHADGSKYNSFQNLCDWIDNSGSAELYTVGKLHDKLVDLAAPEKVYSEIYLKDKFQDHYESHLFFVKCGQTHWKSKNSGYDLISPILFIFFVGLNGIRASKN